MHIAKKKIHDVCVIGSGAAGGFVAQELTAAGADTILLEAGQQGRLAELHIHDAPYELPRRGFGVFKQASLYPDNISREIEYRGDRISVDRIRTLGERTFHWNAACLRFSAADLREYSLNGSEEDWPLIFRKRIRRLPSRRWPCAAPDILLHKNAKAIFDTHNSEVTPCANIFC